MSEGIQVRARERPPEPEPPQDDRSRGERVREALRCPYCRDGVGRRGAVACKRPGCGATYHRECWSECLASYGGCAVFGCGCTTSRELTALGWALRLVRLALAAFLFTPRVLRAVRETERRDVFWGAFARTRWIYRAQNRNSNTQTLWVLAFGIPLSYAALFGLIQLFGKLREIPPLLVFLCLAGVPFLMLVLPFLLAFGAVLGWYALRAADRALKNELAALERGDVSETVLARLARGAGKKP